MKRDITDQLVDIWVQKDLFELEAVGTEIKEIKEIKEKKRSIKDVESAVLEWVSRTVGDIEALWEIQISKADSPLGLGVAISHIQNTIGVSYSAALKCRRLTNPIIEQMIQEGILIIPVEGYEVAGIESRRKLLNWYRKLSEKEKYMLPIFGNKISIGRMSHKQLPIKKNSLEFSIVKSAWDLIHQDLEKLGLINANYKSVSERKNENFVKQKEFKENQKERFSRLAAIKLNNVDDFISPSELEPFIQVDQLFASCCETVSSESGKSNYRIASNQFIEFLSKLYGAKPLKITAFFDEHLLSRYRKYLQEKIINQEISSHHANSILSSVRKALHRLTQVRDMEYSFFDINGFSTSRETDIKKPFTTNERLQILEAIEKGIEESRAGLIHYNKSGIGKNPLDKNGLRIRGLSTLENARWLFENSLNCKPVHHNTVQSTIEKSFLKIISDSDKGLIEVYSEWGITSMVTVDTLTPYLLRLAQITGLNTDSLLSLNLDDYVDSHPATSRACLRYWKERSDGCKEYHLDLFNAELTWLTSTQAKSVKVIFEEVIDLTSSFRQNIDNDELKNRLFIYQSNSTKKHGRISPLLGNEGKNGKSLGDSFNRFVDKYNLKNDAGNPLTLTISRFRPTFVSEMLINGVSLREIQLMLGHSSIQMTIKYIDSLDFNSMSRMKINDIVEPL